MEKDDIALRIEAFDEANGGGVGWYKDKGAYHLYLLATEVPIARLKPTGRSDEVRIAYWSENGKTSTIWAAVSCPSIRRSATSQPTAFSGPGPDQNVQSRAYRRPHSISCTRSRKPLASRAATTEVSQFARQMSWCCPSRRGLTLPDSGLGTEMKSVSKSCKAGSRFV
ncbi:hypothetical protein [Allomesorhizobium alhagi]|uniref:hypothetical protein n=1 Tax=Allomesorhizobium alhagi TaxID=475067 RepID=UPI0011125762|nr:hypothetical protein [Mesorhizobium alhagi]